MAADAGTGAQVETAPGIAAEVAHAADAEASPLPVLLTARTRVLSLLRFWIEKKPTHRSRPPFTHEAEESLTADSLQDAVGL